MHINKPCNNYDVVHEPSAILLHLRGNVHTETTTLNVKLTFVGMWVEMPEVQVATEVSKTIIS